MNKIKCLSDVECFSLAIRQISKENIIADSELGNISKIKFNSNPIKEREKYIYILWDYLNMPNINNTKIKIGISKNPIERVNNIITQSGNTYQKLYVYFRCKNDSNWENIIHKCLKKYRIIGEWFNLSPFECINILNEIGLIESAFDMYYYNDRIRY